MLEGTEEHAGAAVDQRIITFQPRTGGNNGDRNSGRDRLCDGLDDVVGKSKKSQRTPQDNILAWIIT